MDLDYCILLFFHCIELFLFCFLKQMDEIHCKEKKSKQGVWCTCLTHHKKVTQQQVNQANLMR
jgi:hypothetical protein